MGENKKEKQRYSKPTAAVWQGKHYKSKVMIFFNSTVIQFEYGYVYIHMIYEIRVKVIRDSRAVFSFIFILIELLIIQFKFILLYIHVR